MTVLTNHVANGILAPEVLTASSLILSLLSASALQAVPTQLVDGRQDLSVAEIVAAAALFGIDAPAIRMALTRLAREGRILGSKRGYYGLGDRAQQINSYISTWRDIVQIRTAWDNSWWVVLTGHLPRNDRKIIRQRERALNLFGYAEAEKGMWVRPANLIYTLNEQQQRLVRSGLPCDETHFVVSEVISPRERSWSKLWPTKRLQKRYQVALSKIGHSREKLKSLELADAARESFLTGQFVIRCIGSDPLLPDTLVNTVLFDQMHMEMVEFDERGREIWRDFLAEFSPKKEETP